MLPLQATGTSGMEAGLAHLLEPGDTAIIGVNGFFGRRVVEIARRVGAEVVAVEADWGEHVPNDRLLEALDRHPDARLMAVVHAETSTGVEHPLAELGAELRDREVLLMADCVTSLGGVELDFDGWGIDFAYSCTQKCLGAPPGMSPVAVSDRALERIKARTHPVSYSLDLQLLERYWVKRPPVYHHTAPVLHIYALHEALREVAIEGLHARWDRHREAGRHLQQELRSHGLALLAEPDHQLPQLSAIRVPDGVDAKGVQSRMLGQHGIEIGGGLGPSAPAMWRIGLMVSTPPSASQTGCWPRSTPCSPRSRPWLSEPDAPAHHPTRINLFAPPGVEFLIRVRACPQRGPRQIGYATPGPRHALGLGGLERVAEQHRDRHRPDATRHRGDQPGDLGRRGELDVADQAGVGAVDADVDHGRARLDPAALDHLRAPDGGDQHVGAAAHRVQVTGARVADRDGGVLGQQQRRHRLAHQVRAADDDRLGALERHVVAAQQLDHARRRAGPQARQALGQQTRRHRGQPVDVLGGVDQRRQVRAVDVRRRGQLQQDARHARVGVELGQQLDHLLLRGVGRQVVREALDADFGQARCLPAT